MEFGHKREYIFKQETKITRKQKLKNGSKTTNNSRLHTNTGNS